MTMDCNTDINDFTAFSYVRGSVGGYPLTDESISVVLLDNGIPAETPVVDLSIKQKDFLKMGAYEQVLASPSMSSSISDSNGVWSHKEGATERNGVDQQELLRRINAIKKKYGLLPSSIQMHNLGINVWRK